MTPPGPSLRTRALLAVALYVGFHLLAVAIAAALLYLPYAQWRYNDRVSGRLLLTGVVGAFLILRALLPRPERWADPGPRLERARQPRLFAVVDEVAASTGQRPPEVVYLVPEVNAFVAEPSGVPGATGRTRVMGVGLPLLAALDTAQLRAVIAHEFGHYAGGDTQLGGWVYRTRAAIGRTLDALGDSAWLSKPFEWYGTAYMRVTNAVSRRQEFVADAVSARVAGAAAARGALERLAAVAPAFGPYWSSEVAPVLRRGVRPPIAHGFAAFLAAPGVAPQVERALAAERDAPRTDPYDTHPSLGERLAALAALPADVRGPDADGAHESALRLLDDPDDAEAALTAFLADGGEQGGGGHAGAPLTPLAWPAVADVVYPAGWRELVAPARAGLAGLTMRDVPALVDGWQDSAVRLGLCPQRSLVRGAHREQVHGALGAAVALALHARAAAAPGALRLHAPPGEPVTFRSGDVVIEPFAVPRSLADGTLSAAGWRELCAASGAAGVALGASGVAAVAPHAAAPNTAAALA